MEVDCTWINLKNVDQPFFKIYIRLYQNVIYAARKLISLSCSLGIILQIYGMSVCTCIKFSLTQLENHSQLLCGHDFANERLLVRQFDVQSSQLAKLNKIT